MAEISVPISPGELVDKLTILEIKSERISDPEKNRNVMTELGMLTQTWEESAFPIQDVTGQRAALKQVNEDLWEIEDDIRDKELAKEFDAEFIRLARAVYVTNDRRAALKRDINTLLGSLLVEEKSYKDYQ